MGAVVGFVEGEWGGEGGGCKGKRAPERGTPAIMSLSFGSWCLKNWRLASLPGSYRLSVLS